MPTKLNPVMLYVTDDELRLIHAAQDRPGEDADRRTISNAVRFMLGWSELRRGPRIRNTKDLQQPGHVSGPQD